MTLQFIATRGVVFNFSSHIVSCFIVSRCSRIVEIVEIGYFLLKAGVNNSRETSKSKLGSM